MLASWPSNLYSSRLLLRSQTLISWLQDAEIGLFESRPPAAAGHTFLLTKCQTFLLRERFQAQKEDPTRLPTQNYGPTIWSYSATIQGRVGGKPGEGLPGHQIPELENAAPGGKNQPLVG